MHTCPKCKSKLEVQKTFNQKILFGCTHCKIEDVIDYNKNLDEAYLDFLLKFDTGQTPTKKESQSALEKEGLLQSEDEIKKMIGDSKIDELTRSVLFSKKHYVSHFKSIVEPDPKMGSTVDDSGLDERIIEALEAKGISKFYKFQEDAIADIVFGKNVIITAPTASGKTEAFVIPIMQRIVDSKAPRHSVHALFVYPTKSLARDQYPKIKDVADRLSLGIAVFDGDTKDTERREILDSPPEIIITNFDVLHYHLWHRTKFAALLNTVKFLAVDEAHTYSGIFGSNVHYIIKRLKRICPKIQFVASSATLENALLFCQGLFGVDMVQVTGSGKKGRIEFCMLFPSLVTQRALMIDILKKLASKKRKTLVFSNSHLNSELLALQAGRQKIDIKVHRAGLMANYRRSIENLFKNDKLLAVSATPTLELGIDVGNVDGVISSTIPVNRLVQRIGRAARKGQDGFAFLVLGNDPISQYYKNHPDDYFEDTEQIYIDPKNPFVEEFQVLAMACDKPIAKHELPEHRDVIQRHLNVGNLVLVENRYVPNFDQIKGLLEDYSIRGIGKSIDIFLNGKKVGDRVLPIALEELHPSAVYFLAGTRYRVKELGYPKNMSAKLEFLPKNYPYYTKALTEEWPTIETIFEKRQANGIEVAFCKLHIQKRVSGYVNIELGQEVTQGQRVILDNPLEYDFVTKGIVFKAPRPLVEMDRSENEEYTEASGYHATEHVIIEGSNMITGGVSQDLGGISLGTSGLIFVYDSAIGGNGASKALYDRLEKAFDRSLHIVKECPCKNEAGCPRCTFSYRCGNNNEYLHKLASAEILQRITDGETTEVSEPVEGDKPLV
ncbi:ATP-dependent helicase [Candidatus Nitrosotalea sp. TS]|uniref:DEAD/DEAH box helicase n=1 Tax=Candidatus Nitrosotalea sp. TS TaxID=2341020 RepID=UPI001EB44827|nr:DEAD/DEAH box helicase [Candidatus Nitrosotalea sp. TS]NHI03477.1 ATP-dependent helicase [Candidatus Nitrosotalea sp. TS]